MKTPKCIKKAQKEGESYPRSCPTCGIGPCKFFEETVFKGNTMSKEVTAFESKDGQLFRSLKECELHEAKIKFSRTYYKNPLPSGGLGTIVDLDDLLHFVNRHWGELREVLGR